jgi:CHAP domain-containing protein
LLLLLAVTVAGGIFLVRRLDSGPPLSPLRARIVSIAESQVGYRTDPSDTYCNKFSAYWYAGTDDCGNENLDEEWCADFAAWVWKQAGAEVAYQLDPGYLNGNSASFYVWGVDHGTWHPVGTGYTPEPGDVAVYGLNTSAVTAVHVAVVTGNTGQDDAPDVVNGDGDRTGYSVVEVGLSQSDADVKGDGAPLSGYVSPSSPSGTASAPSGSS